MINTIGTEVKEVFKVKKENGNADRKSRLMLELISNVIVGINGDRLFLIVALNIVISEFQRDELDCNNYFSLLTKLENMDQSKLSLYYKYLTTIY